jgi:hypothetical protein
MFFNTRSQLISTKSRSGLLLSPQHSPHQRHRSNQHHTRTKTTSKARSNDMFGGPVRLGIQLTGLVDPNYWRGTLQLCPVLDWYFSNFTWLLSYVVQAP